MRAIVGSVLSSRFINLDHRHYIHVSPLVTIEVKIDYLWFFETLDPRVSRLVNTTMTIRGYNMARVKSCAVADWHGCPVQLSRSKRAALMRVCRRRATSFESGMIYRYGFLWLAAIRGAPTGK